MGTFFTHHVTRQKLIEELIQAEKDESFSRICLRHHFDRGVLWSVWEIQDLLHKKRYIACDLFLLEQGCWGYKPLTEAVGPFYYNCPLDYLAMVPETNSAWRKKVKAYHRG